MYFHGFIVTHFDLPYFCMTILIDYWFVSKLVANRIEAFVPPYHTKRFLRPGLVTLDWSKDCGAKNDFETAWNWILVFSDPSFNCNHVFNTWEKNIIFKIILLVFIKNVIRIIAFNVNNIFIVPIRRFYRCTYLWRRETNSIYDVLVFLLLI